MQRRYDLYLREILEAIEQIEEITHELEEEDFYSDKRMIAAVMWNLTVIGEAIGQLSDDFKQKYPTVEWREIKDFRNIVIHKYFEINNNQVWKVIQNDLKPLKVKIIDILNNEKKLQK